MEKTLFLYNVKWVLIIGLLAAALVGTAQNTIKGIVRDQAGEPIGFCHVVNETMGMGKVSDQNGRFEITTRKGDSLRFSYVGYETHDLEVNSIHLVNYLEVTLPQDSVLLPSITIYADPNFRVPLNIQGEALIIEGVSITEKKEPIRAGDIRIGASPGVGGVPVPGATIYGPITYFSKDEKERRKAEEARAETRKTITYQKFIAQDSVRQQLSALYKLDSATYDRIIVRLNRQFPGIQRQYNPKEIWNWLLVHFDRTVPVIKH